MRSDTKERVCNVCASEVGVHLFICGFRCPMHPPTGDYLFKPAPRVESEPLPPYPEPEFRARTSLSPVAWRSAESYIKALEACGMAYDVREARGWYPNAKGEPVRLVDSISIRSRDPWDYVRACGVWVDRSFDQGFILDYGTGLRLANLDDLKVLLGIAKPDRTRKPRAATAQPATPKGREGMR